MKSLLKAIHQPIYEHRLKVLVELLREQIASGDRILDVGCGSGLLGQKLLQDRKVPSDITVEGAEKFARGGEPITVTPFDGNLLPFADNSFDIVLLADVLHHEKEPQKLFRECSRVSKRFVIVKDHKPKGFLGLQRICFLDWAANNPYGVECLYKYPRLQEWHQFFKENDAKLNSEKCSLNLYPPFFNFIFGRQLQYWAVTSPSSLN